MAATSTWTARFTIIPGSEHTGSSRVEMQVVQSSPRGEETVDLAVQVLIGNRTLREVEDEAIDRAIVVLQQLRKPSGD